MYQIVSKWSLCTACLLLMAQILNKIQLLLQLLRQCVKFLKLCRKLLALVTSTRQCEFDFIEALEELVQRTLPLTRQSAAALVYEDQ